MKQSTKVSQGSKNKAKRLKIESPKSPHFYITPKLHTEGAPVRPVISSVNFHTSKILKYVDYHPQAIVREITSYGKDTCEFSALEFVLDNSYLVSLDVKSL